MKKLLVALALTVLCSAPTAARAQGYLGGRIGWGFPFGSALDLGGATVSERDLVKSVVPLQVDAGLRMGPLDLAGYFSYGFARPGSDCGGSCDASELRLGVQANLHSPLRSEREVWAGVLLGWERLKLSSSGGPDSTASGWQGGVQAGYDFAGSSFGFGPFGMLTFGEYGSFERGGTSFSGFTKKVHGQFQLGVRGFFKI